MLTLKRDFQPQKGDFWTIRYSLWSRYHTPARSAPLFGWIGDFFQSPTFIIFSARFFLSLFFLACFSGHPSLFNIIEHTSWWGNSWIFFYWTSLLFSANLWVQICKSFSCRMAGYPIFGLDKFGVGLVFAFRLIHAFRIFEQKKSDYQKRW